MLDAMQRQDRTILRRFACEPIIFFGLLEKRDIEVAADCLFGPEPCFCRSLLPVFGIVKGFGHTWIRNLPPENRFSLYIG